MEDPETPAERQARQFDQLRRIGTLAVTLAETSGNAACNQVEQDQDQDQDQEKPARAPNHAQNFFRAAAAVRQIIALELRIEAGPPGRRPADRPPAAPPKPDPRRAMLQQVLHDTVRNDPNRARRRREIDANIEQELLADPDPANAEPIAVTACTIGNRLHLELDLARVSDEFLEYDLPVKTLTKNKFRENSS